MIGEEYKQFLLNHIKPWARPASGGRVINCRCYYCADSKTYSHGHFYISIPQNHKELSLFYCQKCKVGGLVTPNTLIEWNLYDPDIVMALTKHNKVAGSLPENRMYKDSEIYKIMNDIITDDKLSAFKLKYINNRLGSSFTYQDCLDLKLVLNIKDVLTRNHLQATRDDRIIDQLDNGFMGFLSIDNAFLNLRNLDITKGLHKSIDTRYVNYNIFGKYDNTRRFYTVPTVLDLNDMRPIDLHIAEGSFDILAIYLQNQTDTINRNVFTSVGGSGYQGVVRYFINRLKYPNMRIHIYPDSDISRDHIINVFRSISVFGYPMYIHRNISPGEKDYGVTPDRIIDSKEEIRL